jgi:Cu-Zn family superoxide dismutase
MKTSKLFLPALLLTLGFSAVSQETKSAKMAKKEHRSIELHDASGAVKAVATLTSVKDGVKVRLRAHDLTPGEHALHFHQNAKCDAPDFKSAGPHFNPAAKQHGMQNPQGAHNGDMPNFRAKKNGNANFTYVNKEVSLGDDSKSLFTNGGTAIIIHAKGDDYKTDPAGNAGDRIACGMITK